MREMTLAVSATALALGACGADAPSAPSTTSVDAAVSSAFVTIQAPAAGTSIGNPGSTVSLKGTLIGAPSNAWLAWYLDSVPPAGTSGWVAEGPSTSFTLPQGIAKGAHKLTGFCWYAAAPSWNTVPCDATHGTSETVYVGPAPAPSCVAITSPASGATISGTSVPVKTADTCAGVWFETLSVDGARVGDFPTGTITLDATKLSTGSHTIGVTSQSENPGSKTLGSATVTVKVATASTGNAQDSVTLPPGATLPTEAECAAWVAQQGSDSEHAPWNTGSSDGFDYNKPPPGGTPSYFYDYAGGSFSPNPQMARVDGAQSGTTDDLVRIFSCKYGIAANVTRAQMMNESGWHEDCPALSIPNVKSGSGTTCHDGGDLNNPPGNPSGLPVTSITPGGVFSALDGAGGLSGTNHYDSWGIEQDKVYYVWMYWPMIAVSTAWALDVRAAELRSCIDGDQVGYFTSNGSNVADYQASVANAKSSPDGAIPSGMACLQVDFHGLPKTNIDCVTIGCFGTHYSGSWFYNATEIAYESDGFGHIAAHDWPGGETN